jgi:mono/diheme cytochrome c family protein
MLPVMNRFKLLLSASLLLSSSLPVAAANSKAAEQAGAILFRDKGCAYCHGATGAGGKKGPDLSGIRTDKLWPPDKIATQIRDGGQKMPPFADSVTDAEIADLVAYLRAKHRPVPAPSEESSPGPGRPVAPQVIPPSAPQQHP